MSESKYFRQLAMIMADLHDKSMMRNGRAVKKPQVFGGDTHGKCCGACVDLGQVNLVSNKRKACREDLCLDAVRCPGLKGLWRDEGLGEETDDLSLWADSLQPIVGKYYQLINSIESNR